MNEQVQIQIRIQIQVQVLIQIWNDMDVMHKLVAVVSAQVIRSIAQADFS